jgi:hypothetical protein
LRPEIVALSSRVVRLAYKHINTIDEFFRHLSDDVLPIVLQRHSRSPARTKRLISLAANRTDRYMVWDSTQQLFIDGLDDCA